MAYYSLKQQKYFKFTGTKPIYITDG